MINIKSAWINNYFQLIDMHGIDSTWMRSNGSQVDVKVGFRTLGRDDVELINAYGIGARAITLCENDADILPEKFDSFLIGNEEYIVQAVHPAYIMGELVSYRIVAVGK